eukprot:2463954-Ditylum_brightwellii.AAC.1
MEEFHIRQEISPNGYITMVLYVTIAHTLEWSKLKFADPVIHHLNNKRVFAYVNEFNKQKASIPSTIGCVHPKLVNLKKLKDTLEIGMKSAKCDEEQVVYEWKQKQQDVEETTNIISHFK